MITNSYCLCFDLFGTPLSICPVEENSSFSIVFEKGLLN